MSKGRIILILALALLVRVYLIFFTYCATNDAWGYVQLAKSISSGDIDSALNHEQHPLYPLLIALSHFFVSDWVAAGQLVSVILGTLTVIPVYILVKRVFNEKAALLTAVLFAVHPYMCRFSAEVITDSTYLFFFLFSVWFGYLGIESDGNSREDGRKDPEYYLCICGLLAGLAYLTRPEGGGIMVVLTSWLIIRITRHALRSVRGLRTELSWLGNARRLIYLLVSFTLVASLYLLDIRHRTGHWRPTKKKKVAEIILPKEGQLSKTDRVIEESHDAAKLKRALRSGPKKHNRAWPGAPYLYGAGAVLSEYANTYHYLLILFLVLGLIKRGADPRWKWRRGEMYLLPFITLYLAMIYGLAVSSSYLSGRHTLSLVALSLGWAGVGILRTSEWAPRKLQQLALFKTARRSLAVVMIVVLAVVLPKTLKPQRRDKLGLRLAGKAIKKLGGPNAPIMSEATQIALYADGNHLGLNRAFLSKERGRAGKKVKVDVSYRAIVDYATRRGAKYLAVRTELLRNILPDFWESARHDDRLSLVFRISESGAPRSLDDTGGENDIEVYEIVSQPSETQSKRKSPKP